MKRLLLYILLFMILANTAAYSQADPSNSGNFVEGKLILKLRDQFRDKASDKSIEIPAIQQIFKSSKNLSFQKKFPKHLPPKNKSNFNGDKLVDLSLIYEIKFDKSLSPITLSNKLMNSGVVEYAQPHYLPQLVYTPNDTLKHMQYYLSNIQVFNAWDITKGDTNVVIAIVDTGVDTDHPDMVDNYAYNYDDPINGIDDDNDGYIDNYLGWDVAMNDNGANLSIWGHGINVAGIASATTDNVTGISGVGFSARILPVKADNDTTGSLVAAYEGLIYAADHGADIINNSWGAYSGGPLGQDLVNYATFNKGALVIGAVGNDAQDVRFYPAAYKNVLSVGASQQQDSIKNNSNFGHWVDVFAPGEAMYTLTANNGYGYNGGTSMAAPVVAGIAALVKSQFPSYTPHQIAQQIITTADNIDALNDPFLHGKLGTGRVNAYRAVTENSSPGIEMSSRIIDDHNDSLFVYGDTINISGEFTNYLADATNVNVRISGNNHYFEIISNSINLGNLNTLQTKNNYSNPFRLVLKSGIPFNEVTELQLTITADSYSAKQYFTITLNPDFINVDKNLISTSITSNGRIGYNDNDLQQGIGLIYKEGNTELYEASFMIGSSNTKVADGFRSSHSTENMDFERVSQITPVTPPTKADYEYQTIFNDDGLSHPMNVEITQKNFIFDSPELDNQIFFVYNLHNTGTNTLNDIYAGIIVDWDIVDFSKNKAGFNPQHKMGVSFNTDTSLFFGIKLLSSHRANHYAIDNENAGNGGINVQDGFSEEEKYQVLSTMRDSAGKVEANGNDILDVVSAGPLTIPPDSSVSIGFVIIAAEELNKLYSSATNAQQEFDSLSLGDIELIPRLSNMGLKLSPIPAQEEIHFKFSVKTKQRCEVRVYNSEGKLVSEIEYGELSRNNYKFGIPLTSYRSGVYFLELRIGNKKIRDKFVVVK